MPGSSVFEVKHFIPIYAALNRAGVEFIIVGGQACNLWASVYESHQPELEQFQPYTTKDLDVWSAYQSDVIHTAEILHVIPRLGRPDSAAPDMGNFTYECDAGKLFVHFLTGVYGVKTELILRSKQNYSWGDLNLPVIHPLLSLEAKLKSFYGVDQTDRQDLKHFKMAMLLHACLHYR